MIYKKKLPTISIVTPTWNSNIKLFERVLKELKRQTYPRELIEHIVFDAGSTNGTAELAKKYGCKVTIRADLKVQEQVRQSLAIKKSRGELVLILQSDNIPTSKIWLKEMVQPLLDDKKIFATFSAYNDYEKNMSMMTRYHAFFGTCDPVLYYLGKSDKIPLIQKRWNKGDAIGETSGYWIVKFTKDTLPTLGDNGFMFRKSVISKVNKNSKDYIHVDMYIDLLKLGYNTYGVIKNSVIHVINPDIMTYAKRRVQVKETYYDGNRGKRKYLVFSWKSGRDKLNLLKFIFFSLTFIFPLYESVRGYMKIKDRAWFLHPLLSPIMLFSYGFSELRWFASRFKK
ncbi:MAG: glycosyltransferase family 2 protein [bacterium]